LRVDEMPLFLARGGVSLRLSPHEVFRRMHGCGDCEGLGHHGGGDARHFANLAKEISEDVGELMEANQKNCAVGDPDGHYARSLLEDRRRVASAHVHEHLRPALDTIRALADEAAGTQTSEAVQFLQRLIDADLPVQLLMQLPHLDFEARKDVMNVCSALLRPELPRHIEERVVGYLRKHPSFFQVLLQGYSTEDLALHCGVVLRSCARHPDLVEAFLTSGKLFDLVHFARSPSIEVSSDAFCTLREMLIDHKAIAARWLEQNMHEFFPLYNELLKSGNYCAERQAQKLLTDLFLDKERHYQKIMLSYVTKEEHLAINMNLLKDGSKKEQVDAFQLFKIFVGNPQKPTKIQCILFKNKAKILALLASLPALRPKDAKFAEDVRATIKKVNELTAPLPAAGGAGDTKSRPAPGSGSVALCASKLFQGLHHSPPLQRVRADTADDIVCGDSDDEA